MRCGQVRGTARSADCDVSAEAGHGFDSFTAASIARVSVHFLPAMSRAFDKQQTHWMTLVDLEAVTLRTVDDDMNGVAAG